MYFLILNFTSAVAKKLKALSQTKQCEDLKPWVRSITNHLYREAVSTPAGDGELLVAKWHSVERHMQNLHTNPGRRFPTCAHGKLSGRKNIESG